MGKTREIFKKIIDTKAKISCKDEHNKGRKQYGLTEDIKKRWQEYIELYKKIQITMMTQITMMV